MSDIKMNKQLGTKWFTFYTKVRPWLSCIAAVGIISNFIQNQDVYTRYWWVIVYFISPLVEVVLGVMVFVKSKGDYEDFVRFVNGVLWFEIISMSYDYAVELYIKSKFNIADTLFSVALYFVLSYFIWYRLNIKYFKKRLNTITSNGIFDEVNGERFVQVNKVSTDADKIQYCRNCGKKILSGNRFCGKCGTEIIEEPVSVASTEDWELCKICGADVTHDAEFCHVCGERK